MSNLRPFQSYKEADDARASNRHCHWDYEVIVRGNEFFIMVMLPGGVDISQVTSFRNNDRETDWIIQAPRDNMNSTEWVYDWFVNGRATFQYFTVARPGRPSQAVCLPLRLPENHSLVNDIRNHIANNQGDRAAIAGQATRFAWQAINLSHPVSPRVHPVLIDQYILPGMFFMTVGPTTVACINLRRQMLDDTMLNDATGGDLTGIPLLLPEHLPLFGVGGHQCTNGGRGRNGGGGPDPFRGGGGYQGEGMGGGGGSHHGGGGMGGGGVHHHGGGMGGGGYGPAPPPHPHFNHHRGNGQYNGHQFNGNGAGFGGTTGNGAARGGGPTAPDPNPSGGYHNANANQHYPPREDGGFPGRRG